MAAGRRCDPAQGSPEVRGRSAGLAPEESSRGGGAAAPGSGEPGCEKGPRGTRPPGPSYAGWIVATVASGVWAVQFLAALVAPVPMGGGAGRLNRLPVGTDAIRRDVIA